MQPCSGRKNLYWISQGFPLLLGGPAGLGGASLDRMAGSKGGTQGTDLAAYAKDMDFTGRMLNNANVSVYPIDSRYMAVNDTSISDKAMMEDLAKTTGGVAYTSRRDVANATREAIGDSRVVYVVRYAISDLKVDGKFHAVKIETSRKDTKLRYREGYFAPEPRP
jgi:VWFA-related protein